jgi:prevent-host-death family protein
MVSSTEAKNNFGKYLELSSDEEVIITKNGAPVAYMVGKKDLISFLSDRLAGLVPRDIDEDALKAERLAGQ